MAVRFLAIVNAQNEPLYFWSSVKEPKEAIVDQQFIAEMSLDFVEQQGVQLQANLRKPLMVMLHEGISVFAMLSNTRTKYLVGIESIGDNIDVESLMNSLSDAFVAYQCNPFGLKEGTIQSTQFDQKITSIVENASRENST